MRSSSSLLNALTDTLYSPSPMILIVYKWQKQIKLQKKTIPYAVVIILLLLLYQNKCTKNTDKVDTVFKNKTIAREKLNKFVNYNRQNIKS